jgi:Tol biopolymer transport system component
LPKALPFAAATATSVQPTASVAIAQASPTPAATNTTAPKAASPTKTAAPSPTAVASAPRGKIAYSVAAGDAPEQFAITVANADGSNAHKILDLATWPALSPDGKTIAYFHWKDQGLHLADLAGGNDRKIIGGEVCCFAWSPDSTRLAFFKGKIKVGGKITLANADGSGVEEITDGSNPTWSPDGKQLAFSSCAPNTTDCGIFVVNLADKSTQQITHDGGGNPEWAPRGNHIVYQASGEGAINVFSVNADGSNRQQLTHGKHNDGQPAFSSDGGWIFWRSDQNGTAWAIFVMRTDGSRAHLIIPNVPPQPDYWSKESLATGP